MVKLVLSDEEKMIGSDEELVYSGNLHYIVLIKGLLSFIFFVLLALYIPNIFLNSGSPNFITGGDFLGYSLYQYIFYDPPSLGIITKFILVLSSISILFAILMLFHYIKVYYSSHLTITNSRLIIKTGLIFIRIQEIEIEEIKEINVSSGLLGNFLNYGYIHIDMRFVGEAFIPCVPKPFDFIHKINSSHQSLADDIEKVIN